MRPERWQQVKQLFQSAIERPLEERAAFLTEACPDDPTLRREVESLISHEQAGSSIEALAYQVATQALADNQAASAVRERIGPYRIIREIGRGGMGAVYLAARADDQYKRLVAIKIIRRGMDTDFITRRFLSERQILASLDHPNIARLYDGGTTEDGLPYLVMEYIEGELIYDYCDANRLNTVERLKLFRTVCSAVQYAHQNLVVHRDIKPSNIIVTADGSPKLLDFGIAKLLNPELSGMTADPTMTALRMMTPEYASPEQVRGDAITTATDIYSLGVVLYELLTGHRPYRIKNHTPQEMLRVICEQEPERLSTAIDRVVETAGAAGPVTLTPEQVSKTREGELHKLRRRLAGDIDNIVLKALRKEPGRRYASAEQFSEDIRRYLEGKPVMARKDTVGYRAGKFIKRHKAGVAAAAAFVILLVCATAITSWQALVAQRERAKAEQRFNDVRKLSNSLLSDVQESLKELPGAGPTQRLLAQNALQYLDRLAQDSGDDPALLGEIAAGYIKVGHLQRSQLHDTVSALPNYQKAVELYRKRVAFAPGDMTMKQDLISGLAALGEVIAARGRREELLQVREEILDLIQARLAAEPGDAEIVFSLGVNYFSRGESQAALRRKEEAKADFRAALDLVTQAIERSKDRAQEPQARIDLSFKYMWQGEILGYLGEWRNAAESQRAAGEIAEAVWRENPSMTQALRNTSRSHRYLGEALEQLGDYRGVLESYRVSLRVITEARAKNPRLPGMFHGQSFYTIRVGTALAKVGETASAIRMVREGLTLARKHIEEDKSDAGRILYSDELFQPAGDFFAGIGRRAEAVAAYRELIDNFEELSKLSPGEPHLIGSLANFYAAVGDILAGFNPQTKDFASTNPADFVEARRWYQKSLEARRVQRELLEAPHPDTEASLNATAEKLHRCDAKLSK